MKFEISSHSIDKVSSDVAVVFAFEGKEDVIPTKSFSALDKTLGGFLTDAAKLERFTGKSGAVIIVHTLIKSGSTRGKIVSPRIAFAGLGKKEEFGSHELRKALSKVAKRLSKNINSIAVSWLDSSETKFDAKLCSRMIAEGLLLGSYIFARYKKKEKDEKEVELAILCEPDKNLHRQIQEGIEQGELYYQATKLARDLVNDQSAIVTPTFLANVAVDIAKKSNDVVCNVYEREEIAKMGMEAFLGVARAAETAPKFIVLEYLPAGRQAPGKQKLAIVGKGITFDSGGINIKPEQGMSTMKCDMAGAATVLGVFSVISDIKPDYPVMGIIAATPNLISGSALVPGDVLRAMNGKTIEVLNTDAEGRVTLADGLSYAVHKGAPEIIDLATLTGACMVALGTDYAGLFSNNQELAKKVKKAGEQSGERLWELPLPKEYKDLNKSEVADIANIPSSRYGGAITAALFLQEFIGSAAWVHLDIAGPAFYDKEHELGPKGGSGFGVRMLLNLLSA